MSKSVGKSGVTSTATEPRPSARTPLIALLYAARGLRGFGDGFAIIILPAYMTALGYDPVACGLLARLSGSRGKHAARRVPPDVLRLRGAGYFERSTLPPGAACAGRRTRPSCAARPLAQDRLQACGTVFRRCLRRRVRRPVAAGALAVSTLRPVAVGRRIVLFLVEHAERVFLSGGGLGCQARRSRQHPGVHAHSFPRVP